MNHPKQNVQTASEMYHTRLASLADADILLEIATKTFTDTFGPANSRENIELHVTKAFTPDNVRSELNDPFCIFLITCLGPTAIGYAKLRDVDAPEGLMDTNAIEIERIYITKEYIGKGIGERLMQSCLDIARERGFTTVWLGVWEHNPRAIAFYEKWGFTKFGAHPFMLGNDLQTDLLMQKKLQNESSSLQR